MRKNVTGRYEKLTAQILNAKILNVKTVFAVILLLSFIVSSAYADIYKYIDEKGVVCYTDVPFNKKADRIQKEQAKGSPDREQSSKPRAKSKTYNDVNTAAYHDIVHEKASAYNVDPSLIKAVIKTESNWNSRAVSKKGAMGLMQLMPSTANDLNVHNPYDPEENIEGGTKYLKYLLEKFNGNLTLAIAAYNAGPKRVEECGYVPHITETKQYVNKVLSLYNGPTQYAMNTGSDSDSSGSVKKEKKSDPIYKIVLNDGTVLFTNSTYLSKNTAGL